MKYARVLLENCSQDTTKLFIQYYTGQYRPKKETVVVTESSTPQPGYAAGAINAVSNLQNLLPLPYMNVSAVASPAAQGNVKLTVSDNQVAEDVEQLPAPRYTPPPPSTAFSSFVDHPDDFIIFLEACLEGKDLKEHDRIDLYTTLFEMYLFKSNEKKGVDQEEWEAKAKKLIEGKNIPIDTSNILLLSHLSNFRDGTTHKP